MRGDEKQTFEPNILVQTSRKYVRLSSLSGSLIHSPTDQTLMQGGVSLVLVCTTQQLLGVLIDLLANGGTFFGMFLRELGILTEVLPFQNTSQLCSHLLH